MDDSDRHGSREWSPDTETGATQHEQNTQKRTKNYCVCRGGGGANSWERPGGPGCIGPLEIVFRYWKHEKTSVGRSEGNFAGQTDGLRDTSGSAFCGSAFVNPGPDARVEDDVRTHKASTRSLAGQGTQIQRTDQNFRPKFEFENFENCVRQIRRDWSASLFQVPTENHLLAKA